MCGLHVSDRKAIDHSDKSRFTSLHRTSSISGGFCVFQDFIEEQAFGLFQFRSKSAQDDVIKYSAKKIFSTRAKYRVTKALELLTITITLGVGQASPSTGRPDPIPGR